jgi:predicted Rdx family selenoprotein
VVARSRPGVLEGATERRRVEICYEQQCTRAEYLEREAWFTEQVLARHPQEVLAAGDYADVLLIAYASRVAWERFVERVELRAA